MLSFPGIIFIELALQFLRLITLYPAKTYDFLGVEGVEAFKNRTREYDS